MEKEKILSTLKEKIGKTSFSDTTLEAYVNGHQPKDGVEPDEVYWNEHVGFLKILEGNYNHDVAVVVERIKKDYKPAGPGDGKPQDGAGGNDSDVTKRLELLEQQFVESRKKSEWSKLQQNVSEKGSVLKVANNALWNDVVRGVEMKDGMTEDDLMAVVKNKYESKLKSYFGDGAVPYGAEQRGGSASVDDEAAKAKRDAFRERMIAQGKLPKESESN